MPLLYFFLYLVVEISAIVWLASAVGVLWTVFTIIAASVIGMAVIRSQGRRVLADLRAANAGRRSQGGAVADGAIVALGSVLLTIPGLVSSAFGLLLMIPAVRSLLTPVIARSAARRVETAVASGRFVGPGAGPFGPGASPFGPSGYSTGHVVVDGEVVSDDAPTGSAPDGRRVIDDGRTQR